MQTLVLNSTTKQIKAVMSLAPETTNPDFVVAYADNTGTSFTEIANDGTLNGTSDVVLIAPPAASTRRVVKDITIQNRDTRTNLITIKYDNNGTIRNLASVNLGPGETWTLSGAFDVTGSQKTTLLSNNNNQIFTGTTTVNNLQVTTNAVITGNLVVEGTTTTMNVDNLFIEDNEVVLLSNTVGSPVLNAQLTVRRGTSPNVQLRWNESAQRWGWTDDGTNFYDLNTARLAYAAANNAANTTRVSQNGASTVTASQVNFVNTASITVAVTSDPSGNANVAFTNQSGLPTINIVTGNTTAIRTNHYYLAPSTPNTAYVLTLPPSPISGDVIWVTPVNGWANNVIGRNGQLLQGLAEDLTIDTQLLVTVQIRYANTGIGWVIT